MLTLMTFDAQKKLHVIARRQISEAICTKCPLIPMHINHNIKNGYHSITYFKPIVAIIMPIMCPNFFLERPKFHIVC